MAMSCMETSIPKCMRPWKLKQLRKGKMANQGNWKECINKDLEQLGLRRMHTIKRNDKNKLEQNLITPVSRDNSIKMNVV